MFKHRSERNDIQPEDKGVSSCPFCDTRAMKKRILRENTHRYIIYNIYPCGWPERGEKQLLLIPKTHFQYTHELLQDQWSIRQEAETWIYEYFAGQSYFSFIKHTDDIKSLQHIHYHYIVWNIYHTFLESSIRYWDEHNLSS